jgi:phosphatidylserine decarboxylase
MTSNERFTFASSIQNRIKRMTIHKEGYKIIFIVAFMALILNTILHTYYPGDALFYGLSIFSIVLCLFVISFFRNPRRSIGGDANSIIAPADGKVVVIEEVMETEYFNEKRLQVSTFMSPANVHVNRSPIDGEVKYFKYHPGRYLVAWHPKSSTDNERTSLVVENDSFSVLIRQIAGKLARRIVYYVEQGDELERGEEFGFIKFGSRVDLFLPLNTKINVEIGQKVRGGETVLGEVQN